MSPYKEYSIIMLSILFKSVLDHDRASVVICNPEHTILYMNPAAIRNYAKYGGAELQGQSLLSCHNPHSGEVIRKVTEWFRENPANNMIYTFRNEKENKDVYMVALRDDAGKFIGYYEKHEYRNIETAEVYDFSRSLI
ncbi:MAG: PAS domain-containing protein [Parasporobacterium sp.]|nr:PAS domain-containing protein [Parasporobacterium sp.]